MKNDFEPNSAFMLQESLLRVPYETMRMTFKNAQKNIEKDQAYLQSAVDKAENLDDMIARTQELKRKIDELNVEQKEIIEDTKARVEFLSDMWQIDSTQQREYDEWSKKRLDVLLAEYFLRNGYIKTADGYIQNKGLKKFVDRDVLSQCFQIEQSLQRRETADCITWCSENRQYLKKVRSSLDFEVRMQYSIELIKQGKRTEAVQYNRKYFARSADTQMPQIQQASGLLAFEPDTTVQPYCDLFSNDRWDKLASMFRETFFEMHGLPRRSQLIDLLSVGMSVLKTYSCATQAHQIRRKTDLSRSQQCPICSKELNVLADQVPHALHTACLVDPDPIVMPNGSVYSKAKLDEFSRKAGVSTGKYCDPATLEIFEEHELKILYPS